MKALTAPLLNTIIMWVSDTDWSGRVYLTLDCAVVNLLTAGAQEVGRAVTDGAPRHHGRPPAGGGGGGGRDLLAEVPGPDG